MTSDNAPTTDTRSVVGAKDAKNVEYYNLVNEDLCNRDRGQFNDWMN